MKALELLENYPDDALDQLARDKLDEIANLRLPRALLAREVASALASRSYVARALAPTRPPAFAFLKLLIESPTLSIPVDHFREAALALTTRLAEQAKSGQDLSPKKNFHLYLRVLFAAWEDDGRIDVSEARILEALRRELGITVREHLLLEHHPEIRPLWDSPRAFEETRNHLLTTGLVLMHANHFAIAEEVAEQIRTSWDMPLEDVSYARLLDRMTAPQLKDVLEASGLQLGGTKDERLKRIVEAMVSPFDALDRLSINDVREICRSCSLPVSASKSELIASLIDYFDDDLDLRAKEARETETVVVQEAPEPRVLAPEVFEALLTRLTNDQLYDLLAASGGPRSGSKPQRIGNLVASTRSERTLLGHLRRPDLVDLCRRVEVGVSGPKEELIDRLISWAGRTPIPEIRRERSAGEEAAPPAANPQPEIVAVIETPQPVPPPAGIKGVHTDFPELDADEQVLAALLKGARALTEREIERAAARHGISWFLTKAHMANLIAKLAEHGHQPIRIRSSAGVNTYEWTDRTEPVEHAPDRTAARDLIDALRQGVVPERQLDLLAVGQEDVRKHLLELLGHVASKKTAFKFLRGPYGAGKTFLSAWLREQAFTQDLAVASVRIGPDQPLSDLPVFFAGLMNGLRTPEKRDTSALADVLESWLLSMYRKTAQVEGLKPTDAASREKLTALAERRIEEEAARLSKHDPTFGHALLGYHRARVAADEVQASTAIGWLRGSTVAAQRLREIGVSGHLEAHQVFPRLRALLDVICTERLRGLLVLVDELELVRRFPHQRQREAAYETLRSIIDECGENELPGCLFVFTATDALFEDQKYGLGSYQALANRIEAPVNLEGRVSMRQPVIHLRGLDQKRLLEVSRRVRELHGSAYSWNAAERIDDIVLERLVENWTGFGGENVERLPRPILRELVHCLDLCEENKDLDASDFLRPPIQRSELATLVGDLLDV